MGKPPNHRRITIRIETSDYPLVSLLIEGRPVVRALHTGSAFVIPIQLVEDKGEALTKEGLHRMFEAGAIKEKWIVVNIV
jgi:hypothetical protein